MRRHVRFITSDFIYLISALIAATAIAFFISIWAGVIAALLCAAYALLYVFFGILQKEKWRRLALETLADKDAFSTYLDTMSIPTALVSVSGSIKWSNYAFREIAGYKAMRKIEKIIPGINIPEKEKRIIINGKPFKKELRQLKYKTKEMLLYRLVDIENAIETKKLYQNFLPVVCYLQIDNYEELAADMLQSELSDILAAVEKRISEMSRSLSAVFLKTDKGRYLCVFERRFLSTLRASKFRILDDVRQIRSSTNPTLSIAIGVGETPEQSADFAGRAMELALGRGGDQAVIKQGDKYIFFGGAVKSPFRRGKVKSRMVSHALRNLFEQCSDVFVMGHESPDLDCMGASLGIAACARYVGKNAYIVLDDPNPSIDPLLEKLATIEPYSSNIISGQEASTIINPSSVLVVVDTQVAAYTVSPNLLELAETVVVIDHHIKGATAIENAALYYLEPNASSISELVTEILQYFGEDFKPLNIELEALLCGITIDTKGFSFNTGASTFEAASYLKSSGADSSAIIKLVQDDIKTYTEKTEIVKYAEILDNGMAIAKCPQIQNAALISAQAADALLTIKGVSASFVIRDVDGGIAISGRSLGDINVQLILESMGGGGHATMAAVKIDDVDAQTARLMLKEAIKNYISEDRS